MEKGTKVLLFLAAVWVVGACIHFAYGAWKLNRPWRSPQIQTRWTDLIRLTPLALVAYLFADGSWTSDDADLEILESKDQYLVCDVIGADLLGCVKISQSASLVSLTPAPSNATPELPRQMIWYVLLPFTPQLWHLPLWRTSWAVAPPPTTAIWLANSSIAWCL